MKEHINKSNITGEQNLADKTNSNITDLGFATVDHDRLNRCGRGEVIYGEGKTAAQIKGIVIALAATGATNILITRTNRAVAECLAEFEIEFNEIARTIVVNPVKFACEENAPYVAIVSAGTSDMYAAEEARVTVENYGVKAVCLYDVGVAGLHRLLGKVDVVQKAASVVVVAGFEGALASVVGGLCSCPVFACPTSVGYGASLQGVTALLAMMSSCASGVSVVNIDNGFGAGYNASLVVRMMTKYRNNEI